MYQDYVANKAKEKTTQLEQYYSQVLSKVQTELNCILQVQTVSFVVSCLYCLYARSFRLTVACSDQMGMQGMAEKAETVISRNKMKLSTRSVNKFLGKKSPKSPEPKSVQSPFSLFL